MTDSNANFFYTYFHKIRKSLNHFTEGCWRVFKTLQLYWSRKWDKSRYTCRKLNSWEVIKRIWASITTRLSCTLNSFIWAATWQNQQRDCEPSEDSDLPSLIRVIACAQWVAKDPSFLHADSEDSDQTGRMPRLIWVFAGRTLTLLVLSCCGSYTVKLFKLRTPYKITVIS